MVFPVIGFGSETVNPDSENVNAASGCLNIVISSILQGLFLEQNLAEGNPLP